MSHGIKFGLKAVIIKSKKKNAAFESPKLFRFKFFHIYPLVN